MKRGVIQNDKYLKRAILEDQKFVIVCEDEKDCNSKRISLYNARRGFSEAEQGLCRIQKMQIDGKWVVRVSRNNPEVYQEINGTLVLVVEPLQESSKVMLAEMLEQGIVKDDIISILTSRGEDRRAVESEIEKLSTRS